MPEEEATNSYSTHSHAQHGQQHKTVSRTLDVDTDDLGVAVLIDCKKFTVLVLLLLFIFPLLPLGLATVFGGLFVLCEPDTSFTQGFLYVVSNLLGMANPLTEYSPSEKTGGLIIDMYVAIASLVCFGILLNIVNVFEVPMAINHLIKKFVKNAFLVPVIAICIFIPLLNAAFCSVFGSLLALSEEWSAKDGILYVLSNSLGLGTPLTEDSPTTVAGKVLDVIISSMALGYIAVFADYVSILNPSAAVRRWIRSHLGTFDVIDLDTSPVQHPLASPSC